VYATHGWVVLALVAVVVALALFAQALWG